MIVSDVFLRVNWWICLLVCLICGSLIAPSSAELIEGFESRTLRDYAGNTEQFDISDSVAKSGDQSLRYDHRTTRNPLKIDTTDASGRGFQPGETISVSFYVDDRTDLENLVAGIRFGSDGTRRNGFEAYYSGNSNELRIGKTKKGEFSILARAHFSSTNVPTNEWTQFLVQWNQNGGIHLTWENAAGVKLVGTCAKDGSFTDQSRFGITTNAHRKTRRLFYFDDFRVLSPVFRSSRNGSDNQPTGTLRITKPQDGKAYSSIVRTLEFTADGKFSSFTVSVKNGYDRRWQTIDQRKASPDQPITDLVSGTGQVSFRVSGRGPDGTLVRDTATVRVRCGENGIDNIDPAVWQTNPYQMINVTSNEQLEQTREEIVDEMYREHGELPERTGNVRKNVDGIPSIDMSNLGNWNRIDEVVVNSELKTTSYSYLVSSDSNDANRKDALFIHKAGHAGNHSEGGRKAFTEEMLDRGYDVLLVGMYARNFNEAKYNHDQLSGKHTESFNPLKLFHDHIAVGLNYALSEHDYEHVFMTGKSGGGWSTATYGAMDPRVDRIYPIAGTQPIYIHKYEERHGHHSWDYEQGNDNFTGNFYDRFTYFDHYMIATAGPGKGGLFINVLRDDCCFYGVNNLITEEAMKTTLRERYSDGDAFNWYVDDSVDSHRISEDVVELILNDADRHAD